MSVIQESQELWSFVREWDEISDLGIPRLKSVQVGPRSLVQTGCLLRAIE